MDYEEHRARDFESASLAGLEIPQFNPKRHADKDPDSLQGISYSYSIEASSCYMAGVGGSSAVRS